MRIRTPPARPGRWMRSGHDVAFATRAGSPQSGNLPGSHGPAASRDRRPGMSRPRPRCASLKAPGPFDSGAKDAMIETLISLFLLLAAPAAAPPVRVRDNAASLPDTGAVAVPSDSLLHRLSRTLLPPAPVVTLPPVRMDAALDRARRRAPTAFFTTLAAQADTRAMVSL